MSFYSIVYYEGKLTVKNTRCILLSHQNDIQYLHSNELWRVRVHFTKSIFFIKYHKNGSILHLLPCKYNWDSNIVGPSRTRQIRSSES